MWGRPSRPNISASPSETASIGSETSPPGSSAAWPSRAATAEYNSPGEKWNCARIRTARSVTPKSSSSALTICTHVVASVLPEIAHRLRDQKHQRRPADQPSGGVDHPVVPAQRDQAGDPEERCSAHVITRKREAVLQRADRTSCGIELARRPRAACSPIGDRQRQRDDQEEEQDGGNGRRAERGLHDVSGMMKAIAQPRGFDVVASIRPHDVYRSEDPRTQYHCGPE